MKRPHVPKRVIKAPHIDPTKNLTPEQLRLIGAITISWNNLEKIHRAFFSDVVGIPDVLRQDVATRINGFEGIKAISTKAINEYLRPPGDLCKEFTDTLNAAHECKTFRDAIIHSTIQMPSGEGLSRQGRKKPQDVLLTEESLSYLHQWSIAIGLELLSASEVIHGFIFNRDSKLRRARAGLNEVWSSPYVQERLLPYRARQKHRKSLKRPTKFPPEPLPPGEFEDQS